MSRALYREYRPASLDDVIGQTHITDTLKSALKKNAIAHAYLFTGPRGVGKTSVARILAHAINELPYDESATHLDIIEIDAASNRRIDEIRDLRDKVHIAPTSAKYKVYIIDEVHMLTREAFNALLKTLEEPPAHAVFILATTEAHKVPETIISRTQRYSFRPIENAKAIDHLRYIANAEKLRIDDEALELLARHGRGSFRDSISMLDQISGFSSTKKITKQEVADLLGVPSDEAIRELISAIASGDSDQLFSHMQTMRESGINPATLAQSLITALRNQIAGRNTTLSVNQTIKLMKELLPLTATTASYEAVEIVLLDALPITKLPVHESGHLVEKLNDKKSEPEPTVEPDTLEKSELTNTADTVRLINDETQELTVSNDWRGILQALKGHHNTLYGVLRMAEAQINDGSIVVTFGFEFHRKQLMQARHLETLKKTAEQVLGSSHDIQVVIKKQPKPITDKKPRINNTLKTVSNIFGDAELLE